MESKNISKASKVAMSFIAIHFIIMAMILFLMEPYSSIFAYDITFIPFIDKFPVMILWLGAMLGSLIYGLYKGTVEYRSGSKNIWLKIELILGYLSGAFWIFFFVGELLSSH